VNTAAVQRPELIGEIALEFGNQCVVCAVDAKRRSSGGFEVFLHGGRTPTGIDAVAVLTFDRERASQAPETFVDELLVGRLGARVVLVGADFRFGARGAGDVWELRRMGATRGFEVELLGDVGGHGVDRISTSGIRALITEGRVSEAAARLGSLPAVTGEVVHGNARGRELGFPTANLSPEAVGVVPADGVYAGWLTIEDGEPAGQGERSAPSGRLAAAISVSDNPTFDTADHRRVEAYVIDRDLELYGRTVTVEFVDRLRGIEAFDSVDALVARMAVDVAEARATLGVTPRLE
ncbi:MAG: hypothetical protein J7480_02080, partial [Microbacteriaceae bacterium]|nr:hypothetical protein [Microbacteriaceae bacterium]